MCRQNPILIKYGTGLPAGKGSRRVYLWAWMCCTHARMQMSTNVTVPRLFLCVRTTVGEWVRAAAIGYWEQKYCNGALHSFIFLPSRLLSSAVIWCALPAECKGLLKLQCLHSFKAFLKKYAENTCPEGARDILQNEMSKADTGELETLGGVRFSQVIIFHGSLTGIRE